MRTSKILLIIGLVLIGSFLLYYLGNILYIIYIISLKALLITLGVITGFILIIIGMLLEGSKKWDY